MASALTMMQMPAKVRQPLVGVILLVVAFALTYALRDAIEATPYLLFWAVAVVATWYGGLLASIFFFAAAALLIPVIFSTPSIDAEHALATVLRSGVFLVSGAIAVAIRSRLQQAEAQHQFLTRAGEVLGSSLDYEKTLTEIAHLAVPSIADWCIIDLLDQGDEVRRLAVVHRNPAKMNLAIELQTHYPTLRLTDDHTLVRVLRSGRAWLLPYMSDDRLRAQARSPEHYQLLRDLGYRSEIIVQLEARGRLLGALTLVNGESGRQFSEPDLRLAQEVARRAALAIDNARLYRETQAQGERLNLLLRSITDGVIAVDRDIRVTFMNPAAERITGWQHAEAAGRPLNEVIRFPQRDIVNHVQEALKADQGAELPIDTVLVRRDGIEVLLEYVIARVRGPASEVEGVVIVLHDISERMRIEQERTELLQREQQARLAAEEANEIKLRFLGIVSHELRTPLATIKGFSSTLLAPDAHWDAEQYKEFIGIIDTEADKLTDLVNQLLEVSQLQAGTLKISPIACRVDEIIQRTASNLKTVAGDHKLEFDIEPALPEVTADQQRIGQVLINLVGNAAKFSPVETSICIRAFLIPDRIQIEVCDKGPGIPPKQQTDVFEAFHQLDHATQYGGAGLGLAICKGIIEAHGGKIWIQSNVGQGTTVVFTLPLSTSGSTPTDSQDR